MQGPGADGAAWTGLSRLSLRRSAEACRGAAGSAQVGEGEGGARRAPRGDEGEGGARRTLRGDEGEGGARRTPRGDEGAHLLGPTAG